MEVHEEHMTRMPTKKKDIFWSCKRLLNSNALPKEDYNDLARFLNSWRQAFNIEHLFSRAACSFWRFSIAPGATNISMNTPSSTANSSNPKNIASSSRLPSKYQDSMFYSNSWHNIDMATMQIQFSVFGSSSEQVYVDCLWIILESWAIPSR